MTEQHSVFSGRRREAPRGHCSQWASLRLQAKGVGGEEQEWEEWKKGRDGGSFSFRM